MTDTVTTIITAIYLPLPKSSIDSYKVTLDNSTYIFTYIFNIRENAWHLTITDTLNNVLVDGAKLIPWIDILYSHAREVLPLGRLNFIPRSKSYPEGDDITFDNINTDYDFLYSIELP